MGLYLQQVVLDQDFHSDDADLTNSLILLTNMFNGL